MLQFFMNRLKYTVNSKYTANPLCMFDQLSCEGLVKISYQSLGLGKIGGHFLFYVKEGKNVGVVTSPCSSLKPQGNAPGFSNL